MADKKEFTPVRFSHLTRHSAPGAIVREQNDWLVFIESTYRWPSYGMQELHAVSRVKQHLKLYQRLLTPPSDEYSEEKKATIRGTTIPTVRFPSWASCSECNLLFYKPWEKDHHNIDQEIVCPACKKGYLSQVTWCAVSSYGDIIDVPWHKICHLEAKDNCPQDRDNHYLKLVDQNSSSPKIKCTKCDTSASFSHTDFNYYNNYQITKRTRDQHSEERVKYSIIEINSPGVFVPENARALVIPPESNIDRDSLEYKLSIDSQIISEIESSTRTIQRNKNIKRAMNKLGCSKNELLLAIDKLRSPQTNTEQIIAGEMNSDQYEALTKESVFPSGADFITHHLTDEWKKLKNNIDATEIKNLFDLVDRLVVVDRLRVIEVYKGFNRRASDANDIDPKPEITKPDFGAEIDWLPSIELFGEGIFFTFNIDFLKQWEAHPTLKRRANEIEDRFKSSEFVERLGNEITPTPRFIMLHTLAHLLIRELETLAGYPASSLQENIYSDEISGMAGILLYTAVPDIAGSLGGIVEAARPEKFIRLLSSAFNRAEWCSLDPVCSEIEGQGPSWLNRAACHGCALVPDTSCSYSNILLDRTFIKGSKEENIPSLLESIGEINGEKSI